MDNYQPGHTIPSCQVELVWEKAEEIPKRLSHKLHISGVKPSGTYIRVSRNPILTGQRMGTEFRVYTHVVSQSIGCEHECHANAQICTEV